MYGIQNEAKAIEAYYDTMCKKHDNFEIYQAGFIIPLKKPFLGASPDGIIWCECCDITGCLEVKCPYRLKDCSLAEFANLKDSCLVKNDNIYSLDRNHAYYYQVQLQMFCTNTTFCDFVIWSKKDIFMQRIKIDKDFLDKNLQLAEKFHTKVIIPELLSKFYTKK